MSQYIPALFRSHPQSKLAPTKVQSAKVCICYGASLHPHTCAPLECKPAPVIFAPLRGQICTLRGAEVLLWLQIWIVGVQTCTAIIKGASLFPKGADIVAIYGCKLEPLLPSVYKVTNKLTYKRASVCVVLWLKTLNVVCIRELSFSFLNETSIEFSARQFPNAFWQREIVIN